MICSVCREDLPAWSFDSVLYKNARINGCLIGCEMCAKLSKEQRKAKRLLAVALLKGPRAIEKSAKRKDKDKRWRKLSANEKRECLKLERTEWEKLLGEALTGRGVQFDVQVPVGPYFVDFQILPVKLAVEVDGSSHDTDERRRKDFYRDQHIRGLKWTIIRFRNSEVEKKVSAVVDAIIQKRDAMLRLKVAKGNVHQKIVVVPPKKQKVDPYEFPYGMLAERIARDDLHESR